MRHRLLPLLRGFAAFVAIAVAVVVVPVALVQLVGWPLPTSIPTWDQVANAISTGSIDDATIIKSLAVIVWLAWANFTLGVALETVALAQGRQARRVSGLRHSQHVAANLLTSVSLALSMMSRPAVAAPEPPQELRLAVAAADAVGGSAASGSNGGPSTSVAVGAAEVSGDRVAAPVAPRVKRPVYEVQRGDTFWGLAERFLGDGLRWREIRDLNIGRAQPGGAAIEPGSEDLVVGWSLVLPADSLAASGTSSSDTSTVTVARGDTLWGLADDHLDDASRWPEIYDRNRGVPQPEGRALTDPDRIHPGWVLQLPDVEASPDEARGDAVTTADGRRLRFPVGWDAQPGADVRIEPDPAPEVRREVDGDTASRTAQARDARGAASPGARPQSEGSDAEDAGDEDGLVIVAGGALAAGLILTLDRLRGARLRRRQPNHRIPLPDGDDRAAEERLRAAADRDTAEFVDLALRELSSRYDSDASPARLTLVGQGEKGLFVEFESTVEGPTAPWVPDGDRRWVLAQPEDHRALTEFSGTPTRFPALVSLGTDPEHHLIMFNLDLEGALHLVGDEVRARQLLQGWALELATTQRADALDIVTVGIDGVPTDLERLTAIDDAAELRRWLDSLPAPVSLDVPNYVVLAADADTELAALIHAAATTRPDLVAAVSAVNAPETAVVIEVKEDSGWLPAQQVSLDLLDVPATDLEAASRLLDQAKTEPELPVPLSVLSDDDFWTPSDDAEKDPIEVRVLGPVEVRGVDRFATNKTMELVVYLALHRTGAVTDTLMEALWPNREPRPARLHTEASRVRKALGKHADGTPYLPDAELGRYRLSDRVGLDYERFTDHLRAARERPEEAGQHLRDALAFVRGAPFSSTATEYSWDRHLGIRMSEEIVDAAHSLAQLCIEAGRYEDAVWAAEQGLAADPLAEVLIRDLMIAADATGNTARVHALMTRLREELADDEDANDADDWLHPDTLATYERLVRKRPSLAFSSTEPYVADA